MFFLISTASRGEISAVDQKTTRMAKKGKKANKNNLFDRM